MTTLTEKIRRKRKLDDFDKALYIAMTPHKELEGSFGQAGKNMPLSKMLSQIADYWCSADGSMGETVSLTRGFIRQLAVKAKEEE